MMFDWFRSKPKKPQAWGSVEEMLSELSRCPGNEVRNRAFFSERAFEPFMSVIENCGSEWWLYSASETNEVKWLKYMTVISQLGMPKILLEVRKMTNSPGTIVDFIDIERAYGIQVDIIKAAVGCQLHQKVDLSIPIDDAISSMDLLIDYDDCYEYWTTIPDGAHFQNERFTSSYDLPISCGVYRCQVEFEGKQTEVIFELSGFSYLCTLTRHASIPATYRSSPKFYRKIRTIR